MKITDIRVRHFRIPLDPPFRASWDHQVRTSFTATLVEVHTDAGLVGYGSGDSMIGFEDFKHLFIGKEVGTLEQHNMVLDTLAFHYARYWPLDIALWDLLGKEAGLPLYRLCGGHSNRVRTYCSTGEIHDPVQRAEEVQRLRERGFSAIKIRAHHEDVREDIKVVESVRRAVGDSMEIMVDVNQGWRMPGDTRAYWDRKTALQVAKELEQYGVYWLEEPLHRTDFKGLAQLRESTSVRIAAGELNRDISDFREYACNLSVDVMQPDIAIVGGFTAGLKIAHLCSVYGMLFCPHTWGNGIGLLANVHLAAGTGLCPYLEFPFDPPGWTLERRDFILASPLDVDADGYVTLPERPGLGVELAPGLERYEIR
ncbi:MAG: mandelate racemase/muconate lactonizing enzyme family protein [Alicyclobacillus sp.]|nr:mandelate racemase/muconate lactonizing enzyme family protein [Alicyclobacillus sp.]